MNILVVENHVLFREGLINLLSAQPNITVVGDAGTGEEAVAKALELRPDLILMDNRLPDLDGLEATKKILKKQPEATIAILAATDSDELLFSAITCGVKGFILKNTPLEKFLASLRALERGEAAFSRTMTGRIIQEFARLAQQRAGAESELSLLTPREQEVLRLLAQEATNREIADKLVISENTVKVHIHNILEKLNLHNRREATRFARRSSLAMVNQNSLL